MASPSASFQPEASRSRSPSGGGFVIRASRDGDLAEITAIYHHHVLHGIASFEEIPPEADELARRRREILAHGLPYLVADQSGRILGYCYASRYRTRSAYRFTLEDSIYVDAAEVGRGIGRALLSALVQRCSDLGYRQIVAVIGGSDQWPSIRLHEALGFTRTGLLPAVGFKFGRWIDTVLMQRAIGPSSMVPPQTVAPTGLGPAIRGSFRRPRLSQGISRTPLLRSGDAADRRAIACGDRRAFPPS